MRVVVLVAVLGRDMERIQTMSSQKIDFPFAN